jgi:non-specific serine/threonine protein kinase
MPTSSSRGGVPLILHENPSVQLFVERARAADPGWALTRVNAPAVAAMCRELDGLPLAIELAAAQVRVLPAAELLRQWQRRGSGRLALLEGGAERRLEQALAGSFAQLSPSALDLLGGLSLCAGTFGLSTVQALAGQVASAPVLPLVRELVEASWLRRFPGEGEPRYEMLEPLRLFAAERPEHTDPERGHRHAGWFLRIAEEAAAPGGVRCQAPADVSGGWVSGARPAGGWQSSFTAGGGQLGVC